MKLINKLLRDIGSIENANILFGGKPILLCGDFRQTLPVIPHASPALLIENCITSWTKFSHIRQITLIQNMRALPTEIEFIDFLKSIGDGTMQSFPDLGLNDINQLPDRTIGNENDIIAEIYGNNVDTINSPEILKHLILAPNNDDCSIINSRILQMLPGEQHVYHSYDTVITDNEIERNQFPVELLNT